MSPVEHLPGQDVMPDLAVADLDGAVRAFVDAASAGRVTESATVHAWAEHLGSLIKTATPAGPARRWSQ